MSDKSKAEKLAAARKLLKEFQQKLPSKAVSEDNVDNIEVGSLQTSLTSNELQRNEILDTSNNFKNHELLPNTQSIPNAPQDMTSTQNETLPKVNDAPSTENTFTDLKQNPFQSIFQNTQKENSFYENLSTMQSPDNSKSLENMEETQRDFIDAETKNIENSELKLTSLNISDAIGKITENEQQQIKSFHTNINHETHDLNKEKVVSSITDLNYNNLLELLQQEKIKNNNLMLESQRLQNDRDNLSIDLQNIQKDTEHTMKLKQDVETLQEQLKLHVKTLNVLVGEKTELIAQINKYEEMIRTHNVECEELQGRLKASRHKAADLEKDLAQTKASHQQLIKDHKDLQIQYDKIKQEHTVNIKQFEDMKDEGAELKEKVKYLINQCNRLEKEVYDKTNELSISNLKILQLSSGDSTKIDSNWEALIEEKKTMQSKLCEMEQNINKSKSESAQMTQQYKQYCQQLNAQMQSLAVNLQEKLAENEKLNMREKELVGHVNELEKQLQSTTNVRAKSVTIENSEKELDDYKAKLVCLEKKHEEQSHDLERRISEIQSITDELKEAKEKITQLEESLETIQADSLDTAKLNAAIESDKVAAARSMAQNADLKLQIEEMQKSFIQMSDYKLEITEKLNCEQHLGRELNSQVIKLESELTKLRTVLEAKDEEMIRLQNENTLLTKEILQQSQLSDRLRHYEAQDNVTDIVQKELQQARDKIANLISRNNELESIMSMNLNEIKVPNKYEEGYNAAKRLIRENSSESSDVMETIPENDTPVSMYESRNDITKVDSVPLIPTHEAMEKLQERFTKTMTDIAELTEEKQRLEHLVLQLQSETETVGEYIALYQNQRSLLKQRELEKDNQLLKLAHDQDDMKSKLLKLNQLVVQLLNERGVSNEFSNINGVHECSPSDAEVTPTITTSEVNLSSEDLKQNLANDISNVDGRICEKPDVQSDTANKIISLLTELKASNLIHPYHAELVNNFAQHCHCCSGRLLTV